MSFGWLLFVGVCIVVIGLAQMGAQILAGVVAGLSASFGAFFAGIAMVFRIAAIVVEVLWLLACGQQLEAFIKLMAVAEAIGSL